ncbi:MAG: divalent-cation tolerance protein CutA [Sphingorhabdus sp.]
MTQPTLIYVVFPSAGEAHDVCRALLAEGLIACANRFAPVISHYRWEGEVETAEEHPVLFKTSYARRDEAMTRIAELHRHKVPAVLAWNAEVAHPAFASWVKNETNS